MELSNLSSHKPAIDKLKATFPDIARNFTDEQVLDLPEYWYYRDLLINGKPKKK